MSTYETITIEHTGHVALVTLNRPDKLNAWDTVMREEFVRVAREVNADSNVRAVVLTGAGRAFSAGADLTEEGGIVDGQGTEDVLNHSYKPGIMAVAHGNKPWISAVNGACAGIGTAYAMACDLMIMADDAYLYQAFGAIGLVPDGGATWQLARGLGRKRAYELMVTGEKLNGESAVALGLCNRVAPAEELVDQAMAWAGEIAEKAPLAMRYAKEAVNFAMENTLPDAISCEARLQNICIESNDSKEGVMAFLEKRKANFTGS
ncbi:enoyl-CoA hydratase/isomerase family protein [Halioglobus pacificus]|uniref:Enoyl-CoA hydratase n=1 Tax=Parahalioglobus pacificus TaxID=930806 RepID=A0A918XF07_9GAMM|nr:enoyl-CoA hydratase/isomerase family protein [Halioglobus pacificus]GHD27873.1 enoyl-CoA hydratase [Halioglobus pacificus]